MPLTAAAVREPQGHVSPSLFPADDAAALDARLAAYIAEAEARPAVGALDTVENRDAAAAAWVYYRAFRAAHADRLASASQRSVDGSGSSGILWSQIEALGKESERWLDEYQGLTGDAGTPERRTAARQTQSIPLSFRW